MKRFLFLILLFFSCGFFVEAQDIHFTQYYTSPLNLNPALTGFFNGGQRFTLQNKSQWRSVTTPFKTLSASYDMSLMKRTLKQDILGGGIVFNRDQAGDSKFGTTQVNLSLSYIRSLSRNNNQFISFGFQAGGAQRTIDYSNLVFDTQWNGSSFNPLLPNGEQFANDKLFFFDMSAGVYWLYIPKREIIINCGASLFHINRPEQSLFSDFQVLLDRKLVIHAGAQLEPVKKFQVNPGILFMKQGTYKEIDIGALCKLVRSSAQENYFSLNFGLYSRLGDAINIIAGLDYMDVSLGISYDVNTSNLVPASHSRGGFELSLIYIINKSRKTYIKKVPCPIF